VDMHLQNYARVSIEPALLWESAQSANDIAACDQLANHNPGVLSIHNPDHFLADHAEKPVLDVINGMRFVARFLLNILTCRTMAGYLPLLAEFCNSHKVDNISKDAIGKGETHFWDMVIAMHCREVCSRKVVGWDKLKPSDQNRQILKHQAKLTKEHGSLRVQVSDVIRAAHKAFAGGKNRYALSQDQHFGMWLTKRGHQSVVFIIPS
jgi:hypothetical protein